MFYGLKIPTHHVVLNKINLKMLQVHAGNVNELNKFNSAFSCNN